MTRQCAIAYMQGDKMCFGILAILAAILNFSEKLKLTGIIPG